MMPNATAGNPPPGIEMPVWHAKPALAGFACQKVVETTFSPLTWLLEGWYAQRVYSHY
jgi:hypothetical protein